MVFTIFYHQIYGETWWNMVKPVNFPQNQVSPSRQKDSPTHLELQHFLPRRKVSDNCWLVSFNGFNSVNLTRTMESESEKMKSNLGPKRLKSILKFEANIWIGSTSNNATCVYKSPLELPWPPD